MFRLQFADPQPSGRPGVAGRQRLGRHTPRTDGGDHAQAAARRPSRLGRADHHRVTADRDGGNLTTRQPAPETQFAGSAHWHTSGVERHRNGRRWRQQWRQGRCRRPAKGHHQAWDAGRHREDTALRPVQHAHVIPKAARIVRRLGYQIFVQQRTPGLQDGLPGRHSQTAQQPSGLHHNAKQQRIATQAPRIRRVSIYLCYFNIVYFRNL